MYRCLSLACFLREGTSARLVDRHVSLDYFACDIRSTLLVAPGTELAPGIALCAPLDYASEVERGILVFRASHISPYF